jgi:sulfide:quinone oxidoreductase
MARAMHRKILIIGGGTAGITVAASLKRHGVLAGDIATVEPSDTHYYQPAFTLVGAGVYDLARTRRPTDSLVPSGRQAHQGRRVQIRSRGQYGRAIHRRLRYL